MAFYNCITGHASWHKPQKIHLVMSMSYRLVFLDPIAVSRDSIVIANAGQMTSHSLQAIQRSSPEGYLRNKCSPLN